MTQSLTPAQQTQMDNRDAAGQWKAKTHADVDDTSDVAGLDGPDAGQATYGALDEEEQQAWHAWREMTGKADETVVGPAKAADIADFKDHYLASSPDDTLPTMQISQRLGLSSDEQDAVHQWDEMVSCGEIEQHQDEAGTFHSFAHTNLLPDPEREGS